MTYLEKAEKAGYVNIIGTEKNQKSHMSPRIITQRITMIPKKKFVLSFGQN